MHKHTRTAPTYGKHPPPLIIDLDLPLLPPQHIRPHLPLVQLPNPHPQLPHVRIAQHHRTPVRPIPCPPPHPPDHIRLVEVVVLLAVGVALPRQREIGDSSAGGGRQPVVLDAALDAVDVAVEEAGVA